MTTEYGDLSDRKLLELINETLIGYALIDHITEAEYRYAMTSEETTDHHAAMAILNTALLEITERLDRAVNS